MKKTDEEQGRYNIERVKAENEALKKYAAIQKAAEDKIGVQKIYIDIAGNIEAALILDEIIFFTLPRGSRRSALRVWKDGYLWLAVHRTDWWERKRLTERQADTAIKKLTSQNLVIKSIYKFNGQTTTHMRLNVREFFRRYGEELEKANPAEDQLDTITKDINDLYAMMGVPELQNGDSPNGETDSPNGETELQNGDSINTPHHPSHNPDINSPADIFKDLFGRFYGKKEEIRWTVLFEAVGKERAEKLAQWAFKKEIHLVNRPSLLDSMETAAKNWYEKQERKGAFTKVKKAVGQAVELTQQEIEKLQKSVDWSQT